MQQTCKNCVHSVKDGLFGDWFCHLITKRDIFGKEHYIKISPNATCDHFSARPVGPKSSDCFLTSACVEYLGKADDCEELTKLRAFRDGYLKARDGGEKLIEEYYQIAPAIVKKINASDARDKHYAYIYETVKNCLTHIDKGENEKALELYQAMVLSLKNLL